MKKCPQCGREYDSMMMFCFNDGAELLYGPATADEPATVVFGVPTLGGISPNVKTQSQENGYARSTNL